MRRSVKAMPGTDAALKSYYAARAREYGMRYVAFQHYRLISHDKPAAP